MESLMAVFGVAVVGYVVVEMVRFRRECRRWEEDDAARWRKLERLMPGIRDRIRQRGEWR